MTHSSGGFRETILVVEDEPGILGLVQSILETAGFRVLTARNAEEAKAVAEGFPKTVHLLLTDVMMPDVSGPELADELKKLRPEMEVILMSGHADGAIHVRNRCWRFLRKPFVSSVLLAEVTDTLAGERVDCGRMRDNRG